MKALDAIVVASILVLGGCGEYPLKESQIEAALPEKTAPIVVGQTDRAAVRQALGKPWLASEYWGFDLYRASDRNSLLHWYLFPMAVSSEDVNGFILVAYDVDTAVVAYDQEISKDPSFLFYPRIPMDAVLRAGDARFQTTADGREARVSVSVAAREKYLRDVSVGTQCRVMFGCAQEYCPARLVIDGDQALESSTTVTSNQLGYALNASDWSGAVTLPQDAISWPSAVALVSLSPGKHRVVAAPAQRVELSAAAEFTCATGEVLYVALRLEIDQRPEKFRFKRLYAAAFEVSPQMPEAFRESPLLIWLNGQWQVPQEPGR